MTMKRENQHEAWIASIIEKGSDDQKQELAHELMSVRLYSDALRVLLSVENKSLVNKQLGKCYRHLGRWFKASAYMNEGEADYNKLIRNCSSRLTRYASSILLLNLALFYGLRLFVSGMIGWHSVTYHFIVLVVYILVVEERRYDYRVTRWVIRLHAKNRSEDTN